MKKSGILIRTLVISGLMTINGQSAVLCESRLSNEICRELIPYQGSIKKSLNESIECISGTWVGTTNSDWNTATNWCDGMVPSSTTDVKIPSAGNQPVINSEAFCKNLTIQSGAKLTISGSNILTVSGDFMNTGSFIRNQSTVIFNGDNQQVGKGPYCNLTFRGNGIKTIAITDQIFYYGLLSMEDKAFVSSWPLQATTSSLQYNTPYARTTGVEWPMTYTAEGITIKNTGIITLNGNKTLTNKYNDIIYRCGITIDENATLNLHTFSINYPEVVNLKCGGLVKGSSIIGTGKLFLENTQVNVTDAEHGTAGAIIACPVNMSLSNTFNIDNDDPYIFTDNDLTINMVSHGGSLIKSGTGELNLGASKMDVNYLVINQGNVTIPVGCQIDVYIEMIVNAVNGLNIESDASGTGSLIATKISGSATAKVERFMTPGGWHIVSSSLSGQLISDFLRSNVSIASDEHFNRGMRDYNPELNLWNDFFNNNTTGVMTTGKGYCIRVRTTEPHKLSFTGILKAGDLIISGLTADKWNCIGNTYTSSMRMNSGTGTNAFLSVNFANLDPLYGAIYIWDQPDASNGMANKYTIVSNASSAYEIQQGQAFMVKMALGKTSINFNKNMQVHNSTLSLKSTDNVWPTIKLKALADSVSSSTIIAFHEGMTQGLDPTYDAGLLDEGDEISLYTVLVEDVGIPFAIQALPSDRYQSTIIPIGIDYTKGGQVSFSAELLHIPSSCMAIFEDRLNNTFTDLSVSSYITRLNAGASSQGRFFLHTSYVTTGIDLQNRIKNFRAWFVSNQEMKIIGEIDSKAKIVLYDIKGNWILSESLKVGLNHTIRLPEIKPGIYILKVERMKNQQVLKLFLIK